MARPLKIEICKKSKAPANAKRSSEEDITFRLITLYDLIYRRAKKESYSTTLKKMKLELPASS